MGCKKQHFDAKVTALSNEVVLVKSKRKQVGIYNLKRHYGGTSPHLSHFKLEFIDVAEAKGESQLTRLWQLNMEQYKGQRDLRECIAV